MAYTDLKMKRWTGSEWVGVCSEGYKAYVSSSWTVKPWKIWTGTNWYTIPAFIVSSPSWETFGGSTIYSIMGDNGSTEQSWNRAYTISGSSWANKTARTAAGRYAAGAYLNGTGITSTTGNSGSTNYFYDISGNSWTLKTGAGVTYGLMGYAALRGSVDKMYTFQGYQYSPSGARNWTYSYSYSGNSWTTTLATHAASDYINGAARRSTGAFQVFGGNTGTTTNKYYSISGDNWTSCTAITSGRKYISQGTVSMSEIGFNLIGGYDTSIKNTNFEFNFTGDSWTTRSSDPGTTGFYLSGSARSATTSQVLHGGAGAAASIVTREYHRTGDCYAARTGDTSYAVQANIFVTAESA